MRRERWWAMLLTSILAMVVAGVGVVQASQSGGPVEDMGSIDVGAQRQQAELGLTPTQPGAEPAPVKQAETALTVPDVTRQKADVASSREPMPPPARLRIPSVDLSAPVKPTGVRKDGLMQIPDDGDRVGWYRYGAAPQSGSGSVVLAGHVDTDEGLGVMAALADVKKGARVDVELADGTVARYTVIGRRTVSKKMLPADTIFERGGPERLTLITCGGPWRSEQDSYRDNVVVVATPAGQR